MLIPIKHENMAARRWPVVTLALIAINVVVFLFTMTSMDDEQLGAVKTHILMLAAMHPELKLKPESQRMVDAVKKSHPAEWKRLQERRPDVTDYRPNDSSEADTEDTEAGKADDAADLQSEMDTLNDQLVKLSAASIAEQYAFVPANPKPIAYLTANFLHGGWMHLIGNMWFLWLAGFVLEDAWGRWFYSVFYLIAGAAALQFYAWTNVGSLNPTLGASGAVAALMGAFLVRFPKMKIEMVWVIYFSIIRWMRTGNPFRYWKFQAAAYWLLPLWLLMEVVYGWLLGSMSGVAHWAHVGGFLFGAVAALVMKHTGIEQEANKAIEDKIAWTADTEIEQASAMIEQGQLSEAAALLQNYVAARPNSLDAWNLLRQLYTRQGDTKSYLQATLKTCGLHLRNHNVEAAFQDHAEFVDAGGGNLPPALWLELCKGAEELQEFERALSEYELLAQAYPTERQALTAQLSAARLCLKKLNRPQDALALYRAAAGSPIPHLDWEQHIESGIKEAKAAISGTPASAAGAP